MMAMRKALFLDGWDERSTWGYDEGQASWFAQLWRNGLGEERGAPHTWITPGPVTPPIETLTELVTRIASATNASPAEIRAAMAEGAPGMPGLQVG
jgi:hypothetical protein